MKSFQWKWIFTGSKTCCTILRPFRFAMAAIWNPKWPSKYKNPQIWAKFCTTIDMIVKKWALIISCYVLTLFFIHTTSTCIVRLGDMYNALRYSNQYLVMNLFLSWIKLKYCSLDSNQYCVKNISFKTNQFCPCV